MERKKKEIITEQMMQEKYSQSWNEEIYGKHNKQNGKL